ncbi:hypothetical protein D9V87_11270 [Bacteroidetes/Chlorobi group bacterium MS-B_bin-24]|jgi:hypothetical protein|nr:MAG: hypothetical protein D9V87_11270 [Bacteroidetes/Chlorobi group bacterium MS-B_bin-24]
MSADHNELEQKLVDFLAILYSRINWGKMHTSKNAHDIFNHRVRAAARRENLYAFASKLCNYFGLQSLPEEAQVVLDEIRPHQYWILNTLSTEHIPFCVRAIMKAKQIKSERLQEKKKIENVENSLFNKLEVQND